MNTSYKYAAVNREDLGGRKKPSSRKKKREEGNELPPTMVGPPSKKEMEEFKRKERLKDRHFI